MVVVLAIILILSVVVLAFLQHPKFGRTPAGVRLEKVRRSPHYKKGTFQNLSPTPSLTEGASYTAVLWEFFFSDKKKAKPHVEIPSLKTDLRTLLPEQDVFIWFGHSSYFIQTDGKKILVDPVLSGAASPLSFTTRAFRGTDRYTPEDIPEIDYLFITHDHWDHLDYKTIRALKPKIGKVICGLGTGAHFERWGYDKDKVSESDWKERFVLDEGFTVYTVPARHFSGRGFRRNKSLWMSFVLQTPTRKIFIGGDSGYDTHFAETGKAFGEFDLAVLENGQYDKSWKYIHMMPEEVLQAAKDLNTKRLIPVHSGKFALANHAWDEPLSTITALNRDVNLLTPKIGELVDLRKDTQTFSHWWKEIN